MLSWFLFLIKKEKLPEFERLGTVPSYNLFLFFFLECTIKYGVSLNQSGAQYRRGKQSWFDTKTSKLHLSFHYSKLHSSEFRLILGRLTPGHWPNFEAVKVKVVKQMKSEFVFVFFFSFTFGHSVSVRDDGPGQNDQFNFLQFVYFCVFMKQYSLTVQVFTVAHRCAMNLWQRVLLCVYCSAIFICSISTCTSLHDLTLRDYQPADKSRHPGALKGCLLLHLIKP